MIVALLLLVLAVAVGLVIALAENALPTHNRKDQP